MNNTLTRASAWSELHWVLPVAPCKWPAAPGALRRRQWRRRYLLAVPRGAQPSLLPPRPRSTTLFKRFQAPHTAIPARLVLKAQQGTSRETWAGPCSPEVRIDVSPGDITYDNGISWAYEAATVPAGHSTPHHGHGHPQKHSHCTSSHAVPTKNQFNLPQSQYGGSLPAALWCTPGRVGYLAVAQSTQVAGVQLGTRFANILSVLQVRHVPSVCGVR